MKTQQKPIELEMSQLIEKRDALRARLKAIQNDYKKGLDSDSEERAIQLENAEVQAGIANATIEELERIETLIRELRD